jgi:hypothetical protein
MGGMKILHGGDIKASLFVFERFRFFSPQARYHVCIRIISVFSAIHVAYWLFVYIDHTYWCLSPAEGRMM